MAVPVRQQFTQLNGWWVVEQFHLSSGGSYLGTDRREYFIEIDGIASGPTGGDTFRWSIDGGAHFNDQQVEIVAGTNQNLSAGVTVNFSASTGNQHGDQWRIKAEPDHYIVEVGRVWHLGRAPKSDQAKFNPCDQPNREPWHA